MPRLILSNKTLRLMLVTPTEAEKLELESEIDILKSEAVSNEFLKENEANEND